MPSQFPFGKPYPRSIDPVQSKIANGRGLYPWSAFSAALSTYSGGALAYDTDFGAETVSVLLFTSDFPVLCHFNVFSSAAQSTNVIPATSLLTLPSAMLVDVSGGTTAVTVTNYGEVFKGYSGVDKAVAVSGFAVKPYQFIIAPLGTTVTDDVVQRGAISSVAVECVANGAVASGVIGPLWTGVIGGVVASAPTPIILRSGDYTQAIKDNGNLIVADNGDLGQVVGLYYSA